MSKEQPIIQTDEHGLIVESVPKKALKSNPRRSPQPASGHHSDPDEKRNPHSAMSVKGSVHGVGRDPSGTVAHTLAKPARGFGDAAPGNAHAATVPLGGR